MHVVKGAIALGVLLLFFRVGIDVGRKFITPSPTTATGA